MKMATLITGPRGSGKSLVADALRARLGHCGVSCIHVELDARRLLDSKDLDVLGKRVLLANEIEEKNAELILVAADPDMQSVKALCHDLHIPLVRHADLRTFEGWIGWSSDAEEEPAKKKLPGAKFKFQQEGELEFLRGRVRELETEHEHEALRINAALGDDLQRTVAPWAEDVVVAILRLKKDVRGLELLGHRENFDAD